MTLSLEPWKEWSKWCQMVSNAVFFLFDEHRKTDLPTFHIFDLLTDTTTRVVLKIYLLKPTSLYIYTWSPHLTWPHHFIFISTPFQAYHFDRDDVALPGFAKFFKKASDEEREHAQKLMKIQNQRGGRIVLQDVKKPGRDSWDSGLHAMEAALELEKTVNQSLLNLHSLANSHNDAQVNSWISLFIITVHWIMPWWW